MIVRNGCSLASYDQPLIYNDVDMLTGIHNAVTVYDKNCMCTCVWKGGTQVWGPYFEYCEPNRYTCCVRARYCVCIRQCICGCYKCHTYPYSSQIYAPWVQWYVFPYFSFRDCIASDCPQVSFPTGNRLLAFPSFSMNLGAGNNGVWCWCACCWNVYTDWLCNNWYYERVKYGLCCVIGQGVNFNAGVNYESLTNARIIHSGQGGLCSTWRSTICSVANIYNVYQTSLVQL